MSLGRIRHLPEIVEAYIHGDVRDIHDPLDDPFAIVLGILGERIRFEFMRDFHGASALFGRGRPALLLLLRSRNANKEKTQQKSCNGDRPNRVRLHGVLPLPRVVRLAPIPLKSNSTRIWRRGESSSTGTLACAVFSIFANEYRDRVSTKPYRQECLCYFKHLRERPCTMNWQEESRRIGLAENNRVALE